jgi:hypothetical protein
MLTFDTGVTTSIDGAGCCNAGVEQFVSISNATGFSTANLVTYVSLELSYRNSRLTLS